MLKSIWFQLGTIGIPLQFIVIIGFGVNCPSKIFPSPFIFDLQGLYFAYIPHYCAFFSI
jgi:hypothetical protein